MVSLDTPRRRELTPAVLLVGMIVLALGLRFLRLGDWSLEGDEIFTLRDSLKPHFDNPRPLVYLLNYYLVRPFLPLDEFGLRLLPAVFGVLAIPVFYLVSRRLLGTRAALLSTLLLVLSPVHVYYSQLARYWSVVFLFSAIYPYALYLGIRERNRRALALGLVTGVLAVLAHPVSALLVGGPGLLMIARLRTEHLARLWRQQTFRFAALLIVILSAAVAVRYIPILSGWIGAHDAPHVREHLRDPGRPGVKQIVYILAYVDSLTLPLVLAGVLGIYLLWQGRDRSLAIFLASLAVFPVAFLTLVSFRTPVSTSYLVPVAPVFFMGAGLFLDRLFEVEWDLRPRWLLPAMVTVIIITAGAPTLISQYRDGRRWDFRGVGRWLDDRLTPGDVVFSDQAKVLAHYLPGWEVAPMIRADTVPLVRSVRVLHESGREGFLWIVVPAPSHAYRTNLKQGGLINWIYGNCQLSNTVGTGRMDFRQQYLQIYRCPPSAASR